MKIAWLIAALLAALIANAAALESAQELATQVRAAETAFARSMADRDIEAFASHVAEDAVFFGSNSVLRGRVAVVAGWKPLYDGPKAPFSWEPEQVEVLDSGTLAHSSGPVRNPEGKQVGTFNSIWRREADGTWKVVFDKGCPVCNCATAPAEPKN
ncbi:MAG TPA: nuclear transport factor 2 family protein [Steroidobacteraceae bacterium]|nr:nuclear transport factor 2 family protein [Steroidobacteraceae bacterium]